MSTQTPSKQSIASTDWGMVIRRLTLLSLLYLVILFGFAGTFNWLMGWVYIVVGIVLTVLGRYLMIRRNPQLVEERSTALQRQDTKSWDKVLMPIVAIIGPFAQIIVASLDFRFHWSAAFAIWLEILGLAIMLLGFYFGTWPMLVNPFFSSTVRIQKDREQHVITTGPYAIVRHPSYMGSLIGNIGIPLLLGSLWAFIPTVLLMIAVILRTKLEDDTLQAELEGYKEYAQQTRYRLIPKIW